MDLMSTLEEKINTSGWDHFIIEPRNWREKIENEYHYYENQAGSFYDNKQSTYPGFAYSIRPANKSQATKD